jgi:hypothetical protein
MNGNVIAGMAVSRISEDLDGLHTAVRRLAALERYSQRSHSKLKKNVF